MPSLEIANVLCAIKHGHAARSEQHGLLDDVEFIFQLADDLLQSILNADHAGGGTEFIDHHSQVALALLEFDQKITHRLGLWDHEHVAHDVTDLQIGIGGKTFWRGELVMHDAREVLGVKQPDDVVGTTCRIENRNTRVLLFDDALGGFIQ